MRNLHRLIVTTWLGAVALWALIIGFCWLVGTMTK